MPICGYIGSYPAGSRGMPGSCAKPVAGIWYGQTCFCEEHMITLRTVADRYIARRMEMHAADGVLVADLIHDLADLAASRKALQG